METEPVLLWLLLLYLNFFAIWNAATEQHLLFEHRAPPSLSRNLEYGLLRLVLGQLWAGRMSQNTLNQV